MSSSGGHVHGWLGWLLEHLLVGGLNQGPEVAPAVFGFLEEIVDDLGQSSQSRRRDIDSWMENRAACLGGHLGGAEERKVFPPGHVVLGRVATSSLFRGIWEEYQYRGQ